jgi:hypothetical protein
MSVLTVKPEHVSRTSAQPSTRQRLTTPGAPKLRYIVVTLMGIFAILAVQLMLSIALSGGAYEIASLKGEMRQTEQERQMVAEDINALVAPDTLAGLATSMGMVADNNPAYLRLSDSSVVGEAEPASAGSGSAVYPVTAGSETVSPPAIIAAVFESVTTPLVVPEEELVESAPSVGLKSVDAPTVSSPVSAPSTPATTTPRFGGTIPSPSTR